MTTDQIATLESLPSEIRDAAHHTLDQHNASDLLPMLGLGPTDLDVVIAAAESWSDELGPYIITFAAESSDEDAARYQSQLAELTGAIQRLSAQH